MKKIMMTLVAMLMIAATGKAMSYEQARNEALFLTDKMAYELNLTDEQYEAAYEINLDYLMGVTSYDDVYSTYWERRNLDMSYILLDWQWQAFINATYFYRPLYWEGGYWHFGIYARYPHRDYFFFGRPVFYASYRGGHAWHHVGGHGYYHSHRDHYRPSGHSHFGMLDRWNRGDYRGNHHSGRPSNDNYGGRRHSSTRTTVNNDHSFGHRNPGNNGNNGSNHGRGSHDNNGRNPGGSYGNHSNSGRSIGHSSIYNNRSTSVVVHSAEEVVAAAVVHSAEVAVAAAVVHSAEVAVAAAVVHSAEAVAELEVVEAAIVVAEAARSAVVVKTRTSAFNIRCTSRIGHCA